MKYKTVDDCQLLCKRFLVVVVVLSSLIILVVNLLSADVVMYSGSQVAPQVVATATFNVSTRSQRITDEATVKTRNRLIGQKCALFFPNATRDLDKMVNVHVAIVSEQLNYFFCAMPKIASTSIKRLLSLAGGAKKDLNFEVQTPKVVQEYFVGYNTLSAADMRDALDNHFKFMFVRHPFERLVSVYVDKFLEVRSHPIVWQTTFLRVAGLIRRRYRQNRDLRSNITFPEFIRYIVDESRDGKDLNIHWLTYHEQCFPCSIEYDLIGHYETMQEDTRYIIQRLGINKLVQLPPDTRPYHKSADQVHSYFAQLPQDHITQLKQIYRFDFEMFGYDNSTY